MQAVRTWIYKLSTGDSSWQTVRTPRDFTEIQTAERIASSLDVKNPLGPSRRFILLKPAISSSKPKSFMVYAEIVKQYRAKEEVL